MKDNPVVKYSLTLFIITFVVGIVLSAVNLLTRDKIAAISAQQAEEAKAQVIESLNFDTLTDTAKQNVWTAVFDGDIVGYVVNEKPSGYGGEIDMYVGLDKDFTVTGVKIVSQSETAGLGAKADSEDFLGQYNGKTKGVSYSKTSSGDNQVQALTGATITTDAVTRGVADAIEDASALETEEEAKNNE